MTFEKGRYTDDVRTCCYELLSLNVGINNVKPVVDSVEECCAGRLPSRT